MNGKFMILNILAMIYKHLASASLQCKGAYSEYCFNGPDSAADYQIFDDAMLWCKKRQSQLAVISESETQHAAFGFLDSWSNYSMSLVYIHMKLLMATQPTWYLINGSIFNGNVIDQGSEEYKLYIALQFAPIPPPSWGYGSRFADWWSFASRPDMLRQYICEFDGSFCSVMNSSFLYNWRCYVKYETDSVNWFEARKRCISKGGDLATFNYPPSPGYPTSDGWQPPFNTSGWNRSLSYWVGIRYNNLSWMSPADSRNESMFYNWSSGKPNNFFYSCVCLDPNALPRWSWTDCNCSVPRPFLCLTSPPTTTNVRLVIGLAVGVGVIIVVVCIITRRRERRAQSSENEEKPTKELARTGEYQYRKRRNCMRK